MISVITQQKTYSENDGSTTTVVGRSYIDPHQVRRVGTEHIVDEWSVHKPGPRKTKARHFIEWLNGEVTEIFEDALKLSVQISDAKQEAQR